MTENLIWIFEYIFDYFIGLSSESKIKVNQTKLLNVEKIAVQKSESNVAKNEKSYDKYGKLIDNSSKQEFEYDNFVGERKVLIERCMYWDLINFWGKTLEIK